MKDLQRVFVSYLLPRVSGGLCVLLGLLVLVGWHTGNVTLIQVHPAFAPTRYNAALGMLLSGVGILAAVSGRRWLAGTCGAVVGALGFLTLTEYVFDLDLGIDQLLMEHYITGATSFPERMAPNAALCLALSGVALLLISGAARIRESSFVQGVLGALLFTIGTVGVFGYLVRFEAAYAWGQWSRMAFQPAIGFSGFGLGILALAWRKDQLKDHLIDRLPALTAVVLLVGTLLLGWNSVLHERHEIRSEVQALLEVSGEALERQIQSRITSLERLTRRWEIRGGMSRQEWEFEAKLLVDRLAYQTVQWVDFSLQAPWIVSLGDNEVAQDLSLILEPLRRAVLESGRNRSTALTRTIDLVKGDVAFLTAAPVFRDDETTGFMVAVMEVARIAEAVLEQIPGGYSMALFAGEEGIYRRDQASQPDSQEWVREIEVESGGLTWRLQFWPTRELLAERRSPATAVILSLGLLMTCLLPLTLGYAQKARNRGQALQVEVTEHRETEQVLRESEERFRKVFEEGPMGMAMAGMDHRFLKVNAQFCRMTGYTEQELTGRAFEDITHPEDIGASEQYLQRLSKREIPSYRREKRYLKKNGEILWVGVTVGVVFDEIGTPLYRLTMIADISERKQMESEQRRLSAAIEQATDAILITDADGMIQYVNSAFERDSGYTREEAVGQNPRILKSGKHDAAFYREMWNSLVRGEAWTGNLINKRKDGTLYEEYATIFPVIESGRTVNYVGIKRDMTHQRNLEAQLQQAQKMEAVGRLAGGVAHDFNNILTGILGYAQLGQGRVAADSPLRKDLVQIEDLGQRAAALTRQLLTFSRRQNLNPRVFNLNEAVKNISKLLGRVIGEDLELTLVCDPELDNVEADPTQMEQVIMNLAINARDAMPDGGNLTIETQNVNLDRTYTDRYFEVKPGRHVVLSVTDSGRGMDKETQTRIFEPFFTTKEVGKGTGLGLSMVYGIVRQHQGHIRVYSELTHGTIFKVYLPCVEGKALEPIRMTKATKLPRGSGAILVAEDEEAVRDLIKQVLEGQGYTVFLASNPGEAEELFRQHQEQIGLLISDVVMPGETGPELHQRLAKVRPLKVLFMSGYTSLGNNVRRLLTSDTPYLQKPFTPAELREKVQEVLEEDPVEEEGTDADE